MSEQALKKEDDEEYEPAPRGSPVYRKWSQDRVARVGFLIGQNWSAARIAADPMVYSTEKRVRTYAARWGLAFRDAFGLPFNLLNHYDKAADERGLTREGLIRFLLYTIASDPSLIDNILDDKHL